MTEGMSELGLRILAELPITLDGRIAQALRDDIDISSDDLAGQLAATLNEGQRWAIAKAAIGQRIDVKRRRLMRHREMAHTTYLRARSPGQRARDSRRARASQDREEAGNLGIDTADLSASALAPILSEARARQRRQEWQNLLAEERRQMKLEVTQELLCSTFALGNGTQTTWGRATQEEHAKRADMLEMQGVSTLHTSMRHRLAVEMIAAAGVKTLGDLAVTDAA